jgi:prepilin-type N-terminal cleavage/methylation domain-containing protein
MGRNRKQSFGFSLVELLAVVLVLATLAMLAVPLYTSQRKSSAARACKANIARIAAAESAYSFINGKYANMATLVGAGPGGLAAVAVCPLDKQAYAITRGNVGGPAVPAGGAMGKIYISCPNDAAHAAYWGAGGDWQRALPAIASDSLP